MGFGAETNPILAIKDTAINLGFEIIQTEEGLIVSGRTKQICLVKTSENYITAERFDNGDVEHGQDFNDVLRIIKRWLFEAAQSGESSNDPSNCE
jgi:hypothetical protein